MRKNTLTTPIVLTLALSFLAAPQAVAAEEKEEYDYYCSLFEEGQAAGMANLLHIFMQNCSLGDSASAEDYAAALKNLRTAFEGFDRTALNQKAYEAKRNEILREINTWLEDARWKENTLLLATKQLLETSYTWDQRSEEEKKADRISLLSPLEVIGKTLSTYISQWQALEADKSTSEISYKWASDSLRAEYDQAAENLKNSSSINNVDSAVERLNNARQALDGVNNKHSFDKKIMDLRKQVLDRIEELSSDESRKKQADAFISLRVDIDATNTKITEEGLNAQQAEAELERLSQAFSTIAAETDKPGRVPLPGHLSSGSLITKIKAFFTWIASTFISLFT